VIYNVPNFITELPMYVCPNQETIDSGIAFKYQGTFVIGTEDDANLALNMSRQEYLPTVLNQFTVNKDINSDPIDTTWVNCDLNIEPPNTDIDYNVFDPKDGIYNLAIGLDNAKNLLEQTKQKYLNWAIQIISFDKFERLPKPIISTGLQSL